NDYRNRWSRKRWEIKRGCKGECFYTGLKALFKQVPLATGDLVMLPTVSDVELEMLGAFLRDNSETAVADWHVYIHNNYLEGRPHEYESQIYRLKSMRRSMRAATTNNLDNHRIHFYATTEQLCDQYKQVEHPAEFRTLTFPVRQALRQLAPEREAGPKRVVCA